MIYVYVNITQNFNLQKFQQVNFHIDEGRIYIENTLFSWISNHPWNWNVVVVEKMEIGALNFWFNLIL